MLVAAGRQTIPTASNRTGCLQVDERVQQIGCAVGDCRFAIGREALASLGLACAQDEQDH